MAPVVILSGTSCAGKTTLARALVAELGRDGSFWYSLDMDVALWGLPKEWWAWPGHRGTHAARGVSYEPDSEGFSELEVGPDARVVFDSFRVTVAELARRGAGVVVSTIVFDEREYGGWAATLEPGDVTWVAVRADAELVKRRERERNESYWPGLAAAYVHLAHRFPTYDLEINSGAAPAADLARDLINALQAKWTSGR